MTFEENNLFLKGIELFEKLLVPIEKNKQKKISALFRLIDLSNCPHRIKNNKKKLKKIVFSIFFYLIFIFMFFSIYIYLLNFCLLLLNLAFVNTNTCENACFRTPGAYTLHCYGFFCAIFPILVSVACMLTNSNSVFASFLLQLLALLATYYNFRIYSVGNFQKIAV